MRCVRSTYRLAYKVGGLILILVAIYSLLLFSLLYGGPGVKETKVYVLGSNKRVYSFDRRTPLIFIGGVPRSGTTLMRVLLDAHPDVRCGQETRVLPEMLEIREKLLIPKADKSRLSEAGVTSEVLDHAFSSFFLEIIARHGDPAARLCNKDPFNLWYAEYLSRLFPRAKFVLMVRDGRATVNSIISRKIRIVDFDLTDYRQCMVQWNHCMSVMHAQCLTVGPSKCMVVYYERLVLNPAHWLREILSFLDIPWDERVLHHEDYINIPGGVNISRLEKSSDQVIKPVYVDSLAKWVDRIPEDVVRDMSKIAPMLATLGYDPNANQPNYGSTEDFVGDNMRRIRDQGRSSGGQE